MNQISTFKLRNAARHLWQGGVVAYPTEGVFGFGCDPSNIEAIEAILRLKGRSAAKGFILIAASIEQLDAYVDLSDPIIRARTAATWPGPVTWIVPVRETVAPLLRGDKGGLAVRVTAHPVAAGLCRAFGGALVSTSANRSGQAPAKTALRVRQWFGDDVFVVPGALGGLDRPTPIFDAASGRQLR